MAAATLTAATYATPTVRSVHAGNFSAFFKFESNGTTISATDVILMGYIPQGTTVIDAYMWGAWSSGASTVKIGTPASLSALGTTTTITGGGVNRLTGFIPRRFSLSSDAEGNIRCPIAALVVAGTSTITGSLNLLLICTNSPAI